MDGDPPPRIAIATITITATTAPPAPAAYSIVRERRDSTEVGTSTISRFGAPTAGIGAEGAGTSAIGAQGPGSLAARGAAARGSLVACIGVRRGAAGGAGTLAVGGLGVVLADGDAVLAVGVTGALGTLVASGMATDRIAGEAGALGVVLAVGVLDAVLAAGVAGARMTTGAPGSLVAWEMTTDDIAEAGALALVLGVASDGGTLRCTPTDGMGLLLGTVPEAGAAGFTVGKPAAGVRGGGDLGGPGFAAGAIGIARSSSSANARSNAASSSIAGRDGTTFENAGVVRPVVSAARAATDGPNVGEVGFGAGFIGSGRTVGWSKDHSLSVAGGEVGGRICLIGGGAGGTPTPCTGVRRISLACAVGFGGVTVSWSVLAMSAGRSEALVVDSKLNSSTASRASAAIGTGRATTCFAGAVRETTGVTVRGATSVGTGAWKSFGAPANGIWTLSASRRTTRRRTPLVPLRTVGFAIASPRTLIALLANRASIRTSEPSGCSVATKNSPRN